MSKLTVALTKYLVALENVEALVLGCETLGLRLFNPRKLLVYRKNVEPFAEQLAAGGLPPGAVADLVVNLERMASPNFSEPLEMAGLKGSGIGQLKAFESAWEGLTEAANRAWLETEDS